MSAYTLKTLAIAAMIIDHTAWAFLPIKSPLAQIMHFVGRLTAPTMCFFIAEGYSHTKNVKKYAARLGLFAVISHWPFYYFDTGASPIYEGGIKLFPTSVIYTLFLGLLALIASETRSLNKLTKSLLISFLCVLAVFGDWGFCAVLWVLAFGRNRDNPKARLFGFSLVSLLVFLMTTYGTWYFDRTDMWRYQIFQAGVFLAVPFLKKYDGSLGGSKGSKWFFYIIYPAHLLLLGILRHRVFS